MPQQFPGKARSVLLGFADQATILQRTLDEEGETDKKLTELAETVINIDALK